MESFRIKSFEEYQRVYERSLHEPDFFWADVARHYTWFAPWEKVLVGDFGQETLSWFSGGKTNITVNCLDRHLPASEMEVAFFWEPNHPSEKAITLTYGNLYLDVCRMANILKGKGVKKGDRVCLYMPMIPQLVVSVLACARIGAVHSVVFAGFSAHALADRIADAGAVCVITADAMNRGAKQMPVKATVDEALELADGSVNSVLVFNHLDWPVQMHSGRDEFVHSLWDAAETACEPEPMDSEDPLFILYTSGSTGKPKGVVHSQAGYMVYAGYSFVNVFGYVPGDVFWCTADAGWITGHTYLIYGPLLNGASSVMFEGIPTYPDAGRFWQIIDKYGVTQFYTAPTAIRSLMALGVDHVLPYRLDSLKLLGSVGEPINEEAWKWYHLHVGKGRCPIVDTWWQTETGGIMISGLADFSPMKPTHAGLPLPGIRPALVDSEGNEMEGNEREGYLCIKYPWPSVIRTTFGNHARCRATYFEVYRGYYFTGDGARRDENGLYRIIGRVDDVINVSGHRFGTAEIENAINQNTAVVESAVVGFPHEIKGQGIFAYVVCREMAEDETWIIQGIEETVTREIGRIAKPDQIVLVSGLPKTRSGKIMRRILRKIAEGETDQLGDTSTLLDPAVVLEIKEKVSRI
jgi:acetyl-CoA synthetase